MSKRPKCGTAVPAQRYAARGERIMEFSSEAGGGLISLRVVGDRLRVELYQLDPSVTVLSPRENTIDPEDPPVALASLADGETDE